MSENPTLEGAGRIVCLLLLAFAGLVICVRCDPGKTEPAQPFNANSRHPKAVSERPDIVLVVMDTVRADHLGIYGYDRPTSPNLDRLASSGAWYSRAYAHSGWTLPSFASLLTGELPHQHRVGRDAASASKFGRLPAEATTLPEELQAAGYATAAFVNNTFLAPEFGLNQGFSLYDYRGSRNNDHRSAKETVRLAIDWVKEQSEPIFMMLHFMEPHAFYDPPEEVRGTFSASAKPKPEPRFRVADYVRWVEGADRPTPDEFNRLIALYDEEILAVDKALGQLLDGLESRQRWEHTVLVVTADHGEEFWDHEHFEHGHDLHGELTRVPLVISQDVGNGEMRDLVDHRWLFRWIRARAGIGVSGRAESLVARQDGNEDNLRVSISENVLRGEPLASVVDEKYRLIRNLQTGTSELWKVDERGAEMDPVQGWQARRHEERLLKILRAARGNLEPVDVVGPELPSRTVFEQLRTLGYVH